MSDYIDKSLIYQKVAEMEKTARDNYINPKFNTYVKSIYETQMNERMKFKHMIADEPKADVSPVVHGKWIDKPTGRYGQWQSWCSACNTKNGIGGIKSNRHKPFCPICGAKMDGGNKNEL